jgi:hypothetical protein
LPDLAVVAAVVLAISLVLVVALASMVRVAAAQAGLAVQAQTAKATVDQAVKTAPATPILPQTPVSMEVPLATMLVAYIQTKQLAWVPMVPSESFGAPGAPFQPQTSMQLAALLAKTQPLTHRNLLRKSIC